MATFRVTPWHSPCSNDRVPAPSALSVAVMTSFDPGGTERQMIELVRRLDPSRWTVHVACFHARGAWMHRALEAAASAAEVPVTSFKTPAVVRPLVSFARWCRARQIAVVQTTELYSNIFGLPGAALANVPVRIGSRREITARKTGAQLALQRAAYACAHKIIANSQAAADRLRIEKVPARKIVVAPNGLDHDVFRPSPPRPRLRTIVVVANLRREKGHDVLIEAAPEVLRRFPDARFEIVGDGPERERLISRAGDRGVLGAFSFLGHLEDVASRLENADLFVLPSQSDASPNAVIEAMAAGLPIVASNVGGIGELVEHLRTGLLVPAGNPPALAAEICRLIDDPPLAALLGAAARARAVRHHSFDRMVAAFESVYLAELARRGVVPARREPVRC